MQPTDFRVRSVFVFLGTSGHEGRKEVRAWHRLRPSRAGRSRVAGGSTDEGSPHAAHGYLRCGCRIGTRRRSIDPGLLIRILTSVLKSGSLTDVDRVESGHPGY